MPTNYSPLNTNVESTTLVNMIDILEQERKRISFDLHDNIQHKLRLIRDEAPAQIKLQIDEVLNDLRGICYNLVPKSLDDFSLQQYLPIYVVTLQRSYMFCISYKSNITSNLPKYVEIELFGILNEAMTNIIKYAETPVVIIRFWEDNEKFSLSVQDIGVGFDISIPTNTLGLASMQNRAKLIGATYQIESEPGDGCKIKIILPKSNIAPNDIEEAKAVNQHNTTPLLTIDTTATKEITNSNSNELSILILDNQEEVIRGLESIIREKFEQAEIVTFTKPNDALEYLKKGGIDIVISDITMPNKTGFQFIKDAQNIPSNSSKYIVYSINNLPIYVARAVKELKVDSFVWKEDEWEEGTHPIVNAIEKVKGGACFYSKEIADIERRVQELTFAKDKTQTKMQDLIFLLVVKILLDKEKLKKLTENFESFGFNTTIVDEVIEIIENRMNGKDIASEYHKLCDLIIDEIRTPKDKVKANVSENTTRKYVSNALSHLSKYNTAISLNSYNNLTVLPKIAEAIFDILPNE